MNPSWKSQNISPYLPDAPDACARGENNSFCPFRPSEHGVQNQLGSLKGDLT